MNISRAVPENVLKPIHSFLNYFVNKLLLSHNPLFGWGRIMFAVFFFLVVICFNFMNGIRAGVVMWPNITIEHICRLFDLTLNQFHSQSWWSEGVFCAVWLCEAAEGWWVWDVILKEVVHKFFLLSPGHFQLRNQLFDILHYCGAKTK